MWIYFQEEFNGGIKMKRLILAILFSLSLVSIAYPQTNFAPSYGGPGGTLSDSTPAMDAVANAGILSTHSRGDHVHPTDTSRLGAANIPSLNIGDILYGSANNVIGKIPDVATGQVLTSGGVNTIPIYSGSPNLTLITSAYATRVLVDGSANYTIQTTDSLIVMSAAGNIYLPNPVGITGKIYDVKNGSSGTVTVCTAAGNLNGASNFALIGGPTYESITVIADGASNMWWIK